MTPHRQVNRPRPKCCPLCDHGGYRRVMDHYVRAVLFQCTNCGHTWERGSGMATDRRTVVRFNAGDDA